MSDQQIACSECGDTFVFTEAEQGFYREKGLASPPKRCKTCRAARKAASGGGGARAPRGNDGPRPRGNDSRPSSGGGAFRPRGNAPRGDRGARPGGFAPRDGGFAPRDRGGFAPRDAGARGNGPPSRAHGNGPPSRAHGNGPPSRAHGNGPAGRGNGEYRSPAFPERRWEPRGDDADRAPRSNGPRTPRPPVEAAPRPERRERERFDITCAECGIAAQVPFKPIEGRQVFCQECYRARRGVARPVTEAMDVAGDADGDIVE